MSSLRSSRRLRWLVPVAVAAVIGLVGLVPTLSSAATPDLPQLGAQQLIAKVQQSKVEAFSGTVALATNLGIPNLGSLQGGGNASGFDAFDLLSGTHEAHVRVDGPERQQLSMPGSLSENSVWHNGRDVWTWESEGHKVTHLLLPADRAQGAEATNAAETEAVPTPDALAKQLLDDLNPSTAVSVTTPAYVADRAVYELVLSPRSPDSTVDHLAMAVDAANGMPLRVQAWAKGQEKAALQLGFTSISYGKPAGSFTFKPPPGSAVTTKDLTKDHADGPARTERHAAHTPDQADANAQSVLGQDWTRVVVRDVQLPRRAHDLWEATTPVSGAFGSGRLLHTSLVNVLFLPDGRVAAGLVTPRALEAAVATAH